MGGVPHAFYAEEARNFLDEYEFARSFGLSNELIAIYWDTTVENILRRIRRAHNTLEQWEKMQREKVNQ